MMRILPKAKIVSIALLSLRTSSSYAYLSPTFLNTFNHAPLFQTRHYATTSLPNLDKSKSIKTKRIQTPSVSSISTSSNTSTKHESKVDVISFINRLKYDSSLYASQDLITLHFSTDKVLLLSELIDTDRGRDLSSSYIKDNCGIVCYGKRVLWSFDYNVCDVTTMSDVVSSYDVWVEQKVNERNVRSARTVELVGVSGFGLDGDKVVELQKLTNELRKQTPAHTTKSINTNTKNSKDITQLYKQSQTYAHAILNLFNFESRLKSSTPKFIKSINGFKEYFTLIMYNDHEYYHQIAEEVYVGKGEGDDLIILRDGALREIDSMTIDPKLLLNLIQRRNNPSIKELKINKSKKAANRDSIKLSTHLPPVYILEEKDIEEQFVRGSGRGGQKINKTSSKVVLKHIPTGIVVHCQSTRSLQSNREKGRVMLLETVEKVMLGNMEKGRVKKGGKGERDGKNEGRARRRRGDASDAVDGEDSEEEEEFDDDDGGEDDDDGEEENEGEYESEDDEVIPKKGTQ